MTTAFAAENSSAGAGLAAQAATHGYTLAFAISAGLFAVGAVMTAVLFTSEARVASGALPR